MKPNAQASKSGQQPNLVFNQKTLQQLGIFIFLGYFLLSICFYFLAGEQLHFRKSRETINMPAANSGSIELIEGSQINQVFVNKIQRLKSISIGWGTYGRSNTGTVFIDLYELQNNSLLLHQELSASNLTEGFISTVSFETPLEGYAGVPMAIRITSNSQPGSAVTPLMNTAASIEDFELFFNEQSAIGILCVSVQGEDYIWTGLHYWKLVVIGAAFLLLYWNYVLYHFKKGKPTLLIVAVYAVQKYRFLIRQLVSRDFKAKYKRSILGVFWSFLNPLLTMSVQYTVFSNLFKSDMPHYPVYLLCGIIMFGYFSEACGMTLTSIVGNASLITKVYMPKYIYPLTRVMSSFNNLLISLIPLFIVALLSGLRPTKAYILLPFILICLAVFCLGFGMLLAAAMVFFRDVQFLWGVVSMIWMYMTPIFYPESILPVNVAAILKGNPLYYFIKFVRICIIEGVSPEPIMYVQCALFALGSLAIGATVFKKTQDRFVLYL